MNETKATLNVRDLIQAAKQRQADRLRAKRDMIERAEQQLRHALEGNSAGWGGFTGALRDIFVYDIDVALENLPYFVDERQPEPPAPPPAPTQGWPADVPPVETLIPKWPDNFELPAEPEPGGKIQ